MKSARDTQAALRYGRKGIAAGAALFVTCASTIGASLLPPAAAANDGLSAEIERGRAKAVQCVACHGPRGVAENPTFPHLAGQHAAYLKAQLERFRSGDREHPLMTPIAMSLSDEEIGALAVYFANVTPEAGRDPRG